MQLRLEVVGTTRGARLTEDEFRALLGLGENTPSLWRSRGVGPKYEKRYGPRGHGMIRYPVEEVVRWLNEAKPMGRAAGAGRKKAA